MKKTALALLGFLTLSVSFASASSCVDLPKNISRYQENSSVLSAQNFLHDQGYLKAKPNGYFGVGTFSAVKAFQQSVGLPQVGNVGPATRAAIKKATCTIGGTVNSTQASAQVGTPIISTPQKTILVTPQVSVAPVVQNSTTRNATRKSDAEKILRTLYNYYTDSNILAITNLGESTKELCVAPPYVPPKPKALDDLGATSTTGGVPLTLSTPDSPCTSSYFDATSLSPRYLSFFPRDPLLATSSLLTGYLVTRGQYNDITVTAKNPENNAIIKVSCNFTANCRDVTYTSAIALDKPNITAINRPIFLRDATALSPFIITGSGFTASNTVTIFSSYTSKQYVLGSFPATGTTTISIDGNVLNQALRCGNACLQKLSSGEYTIMVTNEGGESNAIGISVRSYVTSTFSTQTGSVPPTSKNNKVATITITGSVDLTLTSLTLTSTTTSTTLASKISNFILKDQLTGKVYAGSGSSFSINGDKLGAGQSKVYDIYVDTSAENIQDTGFITYGGTLLVKDPAQNIDMNIPIKDFSFTVSY